MFEDGSINRFPKKEITYMQREMGKLEDNIGGIKHMEQIPGAVFIIDPKKEEIAIKECRKLGIPVVAVVDTNCDPDLIDFLIPGNDDAIRAIKLFTAAMADACLEGAARRKDIGPKGKDGEQTETTLYRPIAYNFQKFRF